MPFEPKQGTLNILKKRYAEASKRSIFFVGAGGSAEVGVPTWDNLAKGLMKALDGATPASAMSEELLSSFHDAEAALDSRNYWDFFGIIEKNWRTLYEDYLSEEFNPTKLESIEIPVLYKKIWRMRNVNQVITLNIDGLLSRAFDAVNLTKERKIQEFPGTSITDSRSYLDRNRPIILHLHGLYKQRSTWVMNEGERTRLFSGFQRSDYRAFLKHIFQSFNVIFVGVNIRDKTISPIIEEISQSGLLQDHFWITHSISSTDYTWAQSHGVRVINYTPDDTGDGSKVHSSSICSILDEIEGYSSDDQAVHLPKRPEFDGESFPSASDLLVNHISNVNAVRILLDQKIESITRSDGFDSRPMAAFIQSYSTAIDVSSIVGATPPYNKLGNLSLTTSISESNSSSVWIALDEKTDQIYAVKSLSGQAFKDKIERESFRRGIESLYHLNSINSPVAPHYYFHTNTPLGVVMELIQGTSLADFSQSDRNSVRESWYEIFMNLAKSILTCHTSEAEVLHRDIKPKNVILEGIYAGCDISDIRDASIRLINFDMSWHKFSAGNSKSVSADEIGYYAPEQRGFANSDSPRTAKTDVYMLGMTLLAILSESPPPEGGSRLKDWPDYVNRKVSSRLGRDQLVAKRISRLILHMTNLESESRPDLQQTIAELSALRFAMDEDWINSDPDLAIEKILLNSDFEYIWDDSTLIGKLSTPRQIELSLAYLPRGQRVELKWMRQRDDGGDRRNFGGKLGEISDQVRKQLSDAGWQTEAGGGYHSRSISANIPVRELTSNFKTSSSDLKAIIGRLMAEMQ